MLSAALLLLSGSLFFSLHLAENPHSFPKPLSAKEEETYLRRWAEGALEARNLLVEHTLRLDAHIINKMKSKMPIGKPERGKIQGGRAPSGRLVAYIFPKYCTTKCGTTAVRQPESGQL